MVKPKCLKPSIILKLMLAIIYLVTVSDTKIKEVDNGLVADTKKVITEKSENNTGIEVVIEKAENKKDVKGEVEKEVVSPSKTAPEKKDYTYIKEVESFNLRTASNLDETEVHEHLKRFEGLNSKSLASSITNAEDEFSINAVFLMAIIRLESGNGTSWLAYNNNNLGGVSNGKSYRKFETKEQCVLYMAQLLSEEYLDENGLWYGGGSTTKDINKYYCELPNWHKKINSLMIEIQNDIKNEG